MKQVEQLIIGTGFSGVGIAVKLKEAGFEDFVVLEKGDCPGGAWRENHYPGCCCDVQSHLYSYSFAPNPDWSRSYAPQQEIKEYIADTARKFGVYDKIKFNHAVTSAKYNEDSGRWIVTCATGEQFDAKVVVSGIGGLHYPQIPNIKGLKKFKGKVFHSAQWEHDYDFENKDVAVIGTGASAIQFVPQLLKKVKNLTLFQRSAPWVLPKPNRKISALEQSLFRSFPILQKAYRAFYYVKLEIRTLVFVYKPESLGFFEYYFSRHLKKQVKDPVLRKKLTPDTKLGCKRVLLSNDYYPALAQTNAHVCTDGIKEVTADSVVDSHGEKHKVDAIVFGTGFKAGDSYSAIDIQGTGGQSLNEAWKDGAKTYAGISVNGFPNFYMMMGPNTGLSHNSFVYMIESQTRYILDAIKKTSSNNWKSVDVKPASQEGFVQQVQEQSKGSVWVTGCQNWYLDEQGRNWALWPGFTFQYRHDVRRFDAAQYSITAENQ